LKSDLSQNTTASGGGILTTYLLLAIYCREQHNEKVTIKRVRELRINRMKFDWHQVA
jgi:hypothetical protein